MQDIYLRLAQHLEDLVMGYPFNDALTDLLMEMFSPVEAEVALAIPNNLPPLEVVDRQSIVDRCNLPPARVTEVDELDTLLPGFVLKSVIAMPHVGKT